MRAALSKAEIETEITSRFGDAFKLHEKAPADALSSGIPQIDSFTGGGLPRGAITEIFGAASSGRTSFMLSALVHATNHDEVCAIVDTSNVFDPISASHSEINLERLLWIRCHNNLEHAFKATDLLLQGGGFGLVMLDLADVPTKRCETDHLFMVVSLPAYAGVDANCAGRDRRRELREILRCPRIGTKTTRGLLGGRFQGIESV